MVTDQVDVENLRRAAVLTEQDMYEAAHDYRLALESSTIHNERTHAVSLALIDTVFVSALAVASFTPQAATLAATLHPSILMLPLGFIATNRMARTVTYNQVMEWLRRPFVTVIHDSSGAGDDVEPRDDLNGPMRAFAELLSCIICSGTWSAIALVLLYLYLPVFSTLLIVTLAIAGSHETLVDLQEYLRWNGRHQREQSGWMNKVNQDYHRFVAKE